MKKQIQMITSRMRSLLYRFVSISPHQQKIAHTVKQSLTTSSNHDRLNYIVPHRNRQKVVSANDAVELIRNGDTVYVSGFVAQGSPEAILRSLGDRFNLSEAGTPRNLTLIFGGGPGDSGELGLSHLANRKYVENDDANNGSPVGMLRRVIGGHYGQVPKIQELVRNNQCEAWALPMGSISRMIRAQSAHSPGHITTIGIGTYVDPDLSGGAMNDAALNSPLHSKLVTKIDVNGQANLCYKALPIDVAIIRGTTADSAGNITLEHESLLCDQRICAEAAKNSGGVVIAQVKRLAANGSLRSREIGIPAPFVDCVVVVSEDDRFASHGMSYFTENDPALTGEINVPQYEIERLPFDIRKIIARRAFMELRPHTIINLGIGLPEGVAGVAAEEGILDYVTLSTEPGVFGGLPASAPNFGPSYNPSSLIEMNQMFDFYDGGGLDQAYLGAAQVSKNGDVNVSRISNERFTGPGGFVDISQSTKNIVFLTSLTTDGLIINSSSSTCNGLDIKVEGKIPKFVNEVLEKTFSGEESVRRGQYIQYVTERAVFRRTAKHAVIELIEIAHGVDLQKDILDQMEFVPVISPHLKAMDGRIFKDAKMKVLDELFGSLLDRCTYHELDHTMYIDLFGITLSSEDDVDWYSNSIGEIIQPFYRSKGPIDMVVNYDGFDLSKGLESYYLQRISRLEQSVYKTVKRYTGRAFSRARLKSELRMHEWDVKELFEEFDIDNSGYLSLEELRRGFDEKFCINLTPLHLHMFQDGDSIIENGTNQQMNFRQFSNGFRKVLESDGK